MPYAPDVKTKSLDSQRGAAAPFRRKRSQERGVAVFIVMMAILVLSGVGTWSMYISGLTDNASGYHRAAVQTLYASEMGALAASNYLSIPGMADANYAVAQRNPDPCLSVGVPGAFCMDISLQDMDTLIAEETQLEAGGPFSLLDLTPEGSIGSTGTMQADFRVEVSDPRQILVEGMEAGQTNYQLVTLTSYGTLRPNAPDLCTNAVAQNAMATRMAMRARMIIGPLSSAGQ